MSSEFQTIGLFVITQLMTAAGIYAAIRADLREALIRVAMAEKRLDKLE
jgi:hypothetical protein